MTDATYIHSGFAGPKDAPEATTGHKPQPLGVPVFIHDCVTPLAGETVLSLLMKRLARDADD